MVSVWKGRAFHRLERITGFPVNYLVKYQPLKTGVFSRKPPRFIGEPPPFHKKNSLVFKMTSLLILFHFKEMKNLIKQRTVLTQQSIF